MKGILVGFGNMGKTHLERYRQLDVDIAAIVETDITKKQQADSYGITTFSSLSEMQGIDGFDFIDICTPTNLHFRNLMEAMQYDKPIFVEKPVVLTNNQVDQLRRVNYSHPIFVGEVEHYNPDLKLFVNYHGRPKIINMSRRVNLEFFLQGTKPWFLDESLSGGIVLDAMIHDINLLVAKYGRPRIDGVMVKNKRYECPDDVSVELSFGGIQVKLYCTWTADDLTQTPIVSDIEVIEENGNRINCHCDNYIIRDKPKELDAFCIEMKAFLDCIRTGRTFFSLENYLVGIEVANEIIRLMGKN